MDEEAPCPLCAKSFPIVLLPEHVENCLIESENNVRKLQEDERKNSQRPTQPTAASKPTTSTPTTPAQPSAPTTSNNNSNDSPASSAPATAESSNPSPLSQEEEDARYARMLQEEFEKGGNDPKEEDPTTLEDENYARLLQEEAEMTARRLGGAGRKAGPPPTRTPTLIHTRGESGKEAKGEDGLFGKATGGGIMRWLRLRDSGSATPSTPDLTEEYKKFLKQIVDGLLPCSKKTEAVQLAALQLAVRMSKARPEDLKKRKRLPLDSFYASYWLKNKKGKSTDDLMQERTWSKYEEIFVPDETELERMKKFVVYCKGLEYYGIRLYHNLMECRSKMPDKEETNFFDKALDNLLLTKKAKELKEKEEQRRERERQNTILWVDHANVILGVTPNCTVVKMNSKTKKVEIAWKLTQIRRFELWRQGQYIMLDFGQYVPGIIVFRSGEYAPLIYSQLNSFISAAEQEPENEDEKRVKQRIASYGLKLRPVAGDGNCQMRAIADQMWGEESRHVAVRNSIVRWLRANKDYPIMEKGKVISKLSDFLESDRHPSWEEYCNYMAKPSTWGDHLTLIAAAEIYARVIWVLSSVSSESADFEENPWTTIEPHLNLNYEEEENEEDWEIQLALKESETSKEKEESGEKEKDTNENNENNNNEKEKNKRNNKEKDKRSKEKESSTTTPTTTTTTPTTTNKSKAQQDKPILLCHWHERHYGSLASVEPSSSSSRSSSSSASSSSSSSKKKRAKPRTENPHFVRGEFEAAEFNTWTDY